MQLIDLSPTVEPGTPHWPGDHGFSHQQRWSIRDGDTVNVRTLTLTAHLGAHIDAPAHVREGAASIEETPLDACVGSCVLVDVSQLVDRSTRPHRPAPAEQVRNELHRLIGAQPIERLLLRHHRDAHTRWDPHMPGLDPELALWFASQGGRLIGVDLDSFDPEQSSALLAHQTAVDHHIVILEGLDLRAAPEGPAELFAAPLPWAGSDAAPVRAVIRTPA